MMGIEGAEISTPSSPDSGYRRLYAKSDGWYDLNSSGTETKLGGIEEGLSTDHLHEITRTVVGSGETTIYLPDYAETVEIITNDGFFVDPLEYTLSDDGSYITLANAPVANTIFTINYMVRLL